MDPVFVFQIIILVLSVVVHEVSHGWAAYFLGDPTAKLAGRLTLNPFKHLDPFGSVILPALLALSKAGIILGWAKPVPYNPHSLGGGKWGPAYVAMAGPASNIFIALVFGVIIRLSGSLPFITPGTLLLCQLVVLINLVLAVFNMIPIPPLDGSKVLFSALPYHWRRVEEWMTSYQLFLIIGVILVGFKLIMPIVSILFGLITGSGF
jgi:Zn-dependent protease